MLTMTQNFYIRSVFALVTVGLALGLYFTHQKFSVAETAFKKTQSKYQKVEQEHQRLVDLKKRHDRVSIETEEQTKSVVAAFRSFGRKELQPVRAQVFSEAKFEKALFFPNGATGSIWIPEEGHKFSFFFELENLPEGMKVDWLDDLPERIDFDLAPNKLYSYKFWTTYPEYKKKESFMRFEFDHKLRFDISLPQQSTGSSSGGRNEVEICQPSALDKRSFGPYGRYFNPTNLLREGAWFYFSPASCHFDWLNEKPEQSGTLDGSVKITCRPIVFGPTTAYFKKRRESFYNNPDVEATEIVDRESPWFGWLKINPDPIETPAAK